MPVIRDIDPNVEANVAVTARGWVRSMLNFVRGLYDKVARTGTAISRFNSVGFWRHEVMSRYQHPEVRHHTDLGLIQTMRKGSAQ